MSRFWPRRWPTSLARTCARRSLMRAVEVADRSLAIAERLNLDSVVAEAFVNKGSALNILGRRREAIALQAAALEMAQELPDRNFEMRVRNNLASAWSDDDPARATRLLLEAMDLARQVGDRGMYNWLAGTSAVGLYLEGRDWDAHAVIMQEALETATLRADQAPAPHAAGPARDRTGRAPGGVPL